MYNIVRVCFRLAVSFSIAATALAAELPGDGKTVQMAQTDSMGANYVLSRIAATAFEKMGYEVKFNTVSTSLFFQAVAQGDIDLSMENNFPQSRAGFERVKDRAVEVGTGAIQGGGYNGYMIDKKTADAYHITTLEQLKDPKLAELFGKDGKAEMVNCDPGWACGDVVDYQLEKFGLKNTVKSVRGKYEALMFETTAKVKRGEPVMFYAWLPSWMTDTLVPGKDVVWLPTPSDALPPNVPNAGTALTPGVVGCAGGADPCRMAMAAWNWQTVANKEFISQNPAIKAFTEQAVFSRDTWSHWESSISQKGGSDRNIKKLATEWIEANKTTFDAWVAKATLAE